MTYSSLAIMVGPDGGELLRQHGIMFGVADGISADTVNLMATHGRGLIACCLTVERAFALGLQMMPKAVARPGKPNFLVSVEAAACTGTGISAEDRAMTLRALGSLSSGQQDLKAPGHIMPNVPGSNDGADLARAALAHCDGRATAWCDILDEEGELASADYCRDLAEKLGLLVIDEIGPSPSPGLRPASHPRCLGEPRRIAA